MLTEPTIFNVTAARETLLERRRRVVVVHPAAKADCIAAKLTVFIFLYPTFWQLFRQIEEEICINEIFEKQKYSAG